MARTREEMIEWAIASDIDLWKATPKSQFWRFAAMVAAEVATWPAWKRSSLGPYRPAPLTERQSAKDGTLL